MIWYVYDCLRSVCFIWFHRKKTNVLSSKQHPSNITLGSQGPKENGIEKNTKTHGCFEKWLSLSLYLSIYIYIFTQLYTTVPLSHRLHVPRLQRNLAKSPAVVCRHGIWLGKVNTGEESWDVLRLQESLGQMKQPRDSKCATRWQWSWLYHGYIMLYIALDSYGKSMDIHHFHPFLDDFLDLVMVAVVFGQAFGSWASTGYDSMYAMKEKYWFLVCMSCSSSQTPVVSGISGLPSRRVQDWAQQCFIKCVYHGILVSPKMTISEL